MIPDEFIRLAEALAETARETAQRASSEPEVEIKSDGTPVTTLDREVEAELRRVIEREQPGHGIVGEEFGAEGIGRDWVWVLDPVDGTRQFAAGLPNFWTLIALCHEGRPVIGVIAHLFHVSVCIGVAGRGTLFNRRPVRCGGPDRLSEIVACISDPDAFDMKAYLKFLSKEDGAGFKVVGPQIAEEKYFGIGVGIGLRKGSDALKDRINEALEGMTDDGSLSEFGLRYFPFTIHPQEWKGAS